MTYQHAGQENQQLSAKQKPFLRPVNDPVALKAVPPSAKTGATTAAQRLPSADPPSMQTLDYVLDPSFALSRPAISPVIPIVRVHGTTIPVGTTALVALGSDGRFEVDVPRGAFDARHAALSTGAVPVGQLILDISQISGHFISSEETLGTYKIQIVDSQGDVIQGVHLLKPITLVYHYQVWEMRVLNLNPNNVIFAWTDQLKAAEAAKQPTSGLALPAINNVSAQTLTVQSAVFGGIIHASGTPAIATPSKPDLYEVSGNSGQYAYSYPIAVAPGTGGFTPQLALNYSSQGTNERYSPQASAGDEGEGWNLSLGSITSTFYPSTTTGGGGTYYSINGVDGVSDLLISTTTSGYYDTQHISHLRVYFTGSYWQAWGLDGTYYEFGNTTDSLRKTSGGTYQWDLNKMIAPFNNSSQVKMMLVAYLQDSPDSGTTIRDSSIKQVQYGYATSTTATSLSIVAGTVDFQYHMPSTQGTWGTAYGTSYNCFTPPPTSTMMRCDDPISYMGISPPTVMSTMSLDTITSYVGADTDGQPAYKYALSYKDEPFNDSYIDPWGFHESAAGEHLLTQITPSVYVQGTIKPRKGVIFTYQDQLEDYYNDPSQGYGTQTLWWTRQQDPERCTGQYALCPDVQRTLHRLADERPGGADAV